MSDETGLVFKCVSLFTVHYTILYTNQYLPASYAASIGENRFGDGEGGEVRQTRIGHHLHHPNHVPTESKHL